MAEEKIKDNSETDGGIPAGKRKPSALENYYTDGHGLPNNADQGGGIKQNKTDQEGSSPSDKKPEGQATSGGDERSGLNKSGTAAGGGGPNKPSGEKNGMNKSGTAAGGGGPNKPSGDKGGAGGGEKNNKKENKKSEEKKGDRDEEGSGEGKESGGGEGSLTSPDAVIMLPIAVLFDIIGLIPVVGDVSDVLAGVTIGAWMLTRKTGREMVKWYILAFLVMATPVASDLGPIVSLLSMGKFPASWTGLVYKVLKGKKKPIKGTSTDSLNLAA